MIRRKPKNVKECEKRKSHINSTLHVVYISSNNVRQHSYYDFHYTYLNYTSLHFTSLHCTSLLDDFRQNFYSFHFTPFIISFLTLFLKIFGLQRKVPNACADSWFQFLMALFTRNASRYPFSASCP